MQEDRKVINGFSPIYSRDVDIMSPACGDDVEQAGRAGQKLFVLGGRRPDSAWLHEFSRMNGLDAWAIDSGAMACRAAGLHPSVIVGDRDSATSEDWQWAVSIGAEEHLHNPDKNLTDFQLALDLLHGKDGIPILTGCFGGRTDHFLSILWTFYRASKRAETSQRPRCMIDHEEGFFFLHAEESVKFIFRRRPMALSLLSMSKRCTGVFISGVRWPLSDVELRRNFPWAISNESVDDGGPVAVSCGGGVLGVSWCY